MGLEYEYGIDMWSLACTLFELYTGRILFQGKNNNGMLKEIMELRGKPSSKLIKKGKFKDQHFDHNMNFIYIEFDSVTKKVSLILLVALTPCPTEFICTNYHLL